MSNQKEKCRFHALDFDLCLEKVSLHIKLGRVYTSVWRGGGCLLIYCDWHLLRQLYENSDTLEEHM